jgi:hypothetical protein
MRYLVPVAAAALAFALMGIKTPAVNTSTPGKPCIIVRAPDTALAAVASSSTVLTAGHTPAISRPATWPIAGGESIAQATPSA